MSETWEPIGPDDIEVGMRVKATPTPEWDHPYSNGNVEGTVTSISPNGLRIDHGPFRTKVDRNWFVERGVTVPEAVTGNDLPEWAQVEYAMEAGVNLWKKVKKAVDNGEPVGCTSGVNDWLNALNLPVVNPFPVVTPEQFVEKVRTTLIAQWTEHNNITREALDRHLSALGLKPYEDPRKRVTTTMTAENAEAFTEWSRMYRGQTLSWEVTDA